MSPIRPAECCVDCDDYTGRAGAADDSLFLDDGRGPFCELCYYRGRTEELEKQRDAALTRAEEAEAASIEMSKRMGYTDLEARIIELAEKLEAAEGALCRAREVIHGLNDLIRLAQDRTTDYLIPDGNNDTDDTLNDLIEILDGPRQREAQIPAWQFLADPSPCRHADLLERAYHDLGQRTEALVLMRRT